jgi:hypothetical protein
MSQQVRSFVSESETDFLVLMFEALNDTMENPMMKKNPTTQKKTSTVSVEYVYNAPHNYKNETYLLLKDFCEDFGIQLLTRPYDSDNRHDKENIERLPAIHIYESGNRERTVYMTRPFQNIEEVYNQTAEKAYQKALNKQKWMNRFQKLKMFFLKKNEKRIL